MTMERNADTSPSADMRSTPPSAGVTSSGEFVLTNPEATPDDPESVGVLLAHGRVLAGLSQGEVATRLRMSVKQIDALERSDYVDLPKGTFLRGFVRNYAKSVGVPIDDALRLLERTHDGGQAVRATPVVEPVAAVAPVPFRARGSSIGTGDPLSGPRIRTAIAVLVVLCLAAGVWYWWEYVRPHLAEGGRPRASEPVTVPVAPPQTAAAPAATESGAPGTQADSPAALLMPVASVPEAIPIAAAPLPVQSSPSTAPAKTAPPVLPAASAEPVAAKKRNAGDAGHIGFTFAGESWVEVLDGTGRTVMSRRYKAGEADEVSGRGPFTIVIGNAQATRMAYNGREFDLAPHTRVSVARLTLK